MTILVVGSTGQIGSKVVAHLATAGAEVRALSTEPEKHEFPVGVVPVKGDLLDPEAMRAALAGVSTMFLLNAVVPDEVTQALVAVGLAREAGVSGIVYFSVIDDGEMYDVPHFAGKLAVERSIASSGLPTTILRNAYFHQNDAMLKDALLSGVFPSPIGHHGVSVADARDIGAVAAALVLERDRADSSPPSEAVEIATADSNTGEGVASLWSEVLRRPVRYGGDDLVPHEAELAKHLPGWAAYDLMLMMRGFQRAGCIARHVDAERLTRLCGRPLRTYREFAEETAAGWAAA